MSLPDLAWQVMYGRLAWAIVAATVLLAPLPATRTLSGRRFGALLAGLAVLFLLPGAASPAHWLGLAFQYPSGLLVACCVLQLQRSRRPAQYDTAIMSPVLASVIVAAGTILYLDAMGLLTQGYYYMGFGPAGAPIVAALGALGCVVAIVRERGRTQAAALLAAILLFSLLRLPTGNLWDALLDPFLWAWAIVTLAVLAVRRAAGRGAVATPVLAPAPLLVPDAVGVTIEHSSTIKEHASGS